MSCGEGRDAWVEGSGRHCGGEVGREDGGAEGAGGSWAPRAGAGLIFPFLERGRRRGRRQWPGRGAAEDLVRPEEVAPALGGTGGWEASLGGPAAPAGGKAGPTAPRPAAVFLSDFTVF